MVALLAQVSLVHGAADFQKMDAAVKTLIQAKAEKENAGKEAEEDASSYAAFLEHYQAVKDGREKMSDYPYLADLLRISYGTVEPEVVREFVAAGADVNAVDAEGAAPLVYCTNAPEIAKILLEAGADANVKTKAGEPLFCHVEGRFDEQVETRRMLRNYGAVVDVPQAVLAGMLGDEKLVDKAIADHANLNARGYRGRTALHWLALNNNAALCRKLLEAGAQPDVCDDEGWSVLRLAAIFNNSDACRELVAGKADTELVDEKGNTALHYAALTNRSKVCRVLVEGGANPRVVNKDGNTPLHLQVTPYNDCSLTKLFLKAGADVNARNAKGATALHCAAYVGNADICLVLLMNGADASLRANDGRSALDIAKEQGHELVRQLMEAEMEETLPQAQDELTKHEDALWQDIEKVSAEYGAMKEGRNLKAKQDMADDLLRHYTSYMESLEGLEAYPYFPVLTLFSPESLTPEVVDRLQKGRADINALLPKSGFHWRGTALAFAAREGNAKLCKVLLDAGAKVNLSREERGGDSPINCGIFSRNAEVVRLLLDAGAELDADEGKNMTELHVAARHSTAKICELLLVAGANPNARDYNANAVLHAACERSSAPRELPDIVRMLISAGADVNAVNNCNLTPLHFAAKSANWDVVKILLDAGADPKARCRFGTTPEDCARARGEESAAKFRALVDSCALNNPISRLEVTRREAARRGISALHYATQKDDVAICRMLLRAYERADVADERGRTPLHDAAKFGNAELCYLLLENVSPMTLVQRDASGRTPLDEAEEPLARSLAQQAASSLLKGKLNKTEISEEDRDEAFRKALDQNDVELCELLLAAGVSEEGRMKCEPAFLANVEGSCRNLRMRRFLVRKAGVKGAMYTPLQMAVLLEDFDEFGRLQAQNVDVNEKNYKGNTALHLAAATWSPVFVSLLLDNGAEVNVENGKGHTPLCEAALRGAAEICQILVKSGASLECRSKQYSCNVLHHAAEAGHLHACRALLGCGVPADCRDAFQRTPLMLVAGRHHQTELFKLFILAGADVNAKDSLNETVLMKYLQHYIYQANATVLDLLLKAGANVNVKDNWDRTPLHYSVLARDYRGCEMLLEAGADIHARCGVKVMPSGSVMGSSETMKDHETKGDTPLDLARHALRFRDHNMPESPLHRVISLLESYQARAADAAKADEH